MNAPPFQMVVENLQVPRCNVDVLPLPATGPDGSISGQGTFGEDAFELRLPPGGGGTGQLAFRGARPSPHRVGSLIDSLFARFPELSAVEASTAEGASVHHRHMFYQTPDLWHYRGDRYPLPLTYTQTGSVRHPERTKPRAPLLYRRFCNDIQQTFSLRPFSIDDHFDLFYAWMTDPTVAEFWEMAFEAPRLRAYAEERMADPHMVPLIGYFDDVPFAYFEAYWAKEDRLGPHYDAQDYDRGFHMAVGDSRFRFKGFGRQWFLSMAHFLYLDDPRSMRLVGEPRIDQVRVTSWSKTTPWKLVKEFDFPHKRAALMTLDREDFFGSFRI